MTPTRNDLPEPATAKGEATRARILEVAARRFGERGYSGTTFAELITASGLTKGAFYFYFPSKELLALAVLERQQLRWQERVSAALVDVPGGFEQVRALGPIMLRMMRADPGSASIARLSRDLRDVPAVADRVRELARNWVGLIAGVLRTAQAVGDVRDDLDPADAAEVLHGAFEGVKDLGNVLDDRSEPAGAERTPDRLRLFLQLVERSLAKD